MTTIAFQQLGDAVEFLADNLEKHNYEAIASHCIAPLRDDDEYVSVGLPSARDYRLAAIKALSDRHAEHSLRLLYERWEFPARQEFKLGGHGKELGHVHVDFEMTPAGWCLKEVWICR